MLDLHAEDVFLSAKASGYVATIMKCFVSVELIKIQNRKHVVGGEKEIYLMQWRDVYALDDEGM